MNKMRIKLAKKILNNLIVFWYFLVGFFLGVSKITSNLFYIFIWCFPIICFSIQILFIFIEIKKKKEKHHKPAGIYELEQVYGKGT